MYRNPVQFGGHSAAFEIIGFIAGARSTRLEIMSWLPHREAGLYAARKKLLIELDRSPHREQKLDE
jgi:hypothetical protein